MTSHRFNWKVVQWRKTTKIKLSERTDSKIETLKLRQRKKRYWKLLRCNAKRLHEISKFKYMHERGENEL